MVGAVPPALRTSLTTFKETTIMSRYPFDRPDEPQSLGDEYLGPPTAGGTEREFDDLEEKVVDMKSRIKERSGQISDKVAQGVDKARINAASGLDRAASVLHEKAGEIPPKIKDATHAIADKMESAAKYMRNADLEHIKDDAVATCKKHPAQTLIGALVAGFLVGRIIRR